ncbi:hypothetical protein OKN36_18710 [Furfurilactobacillus sp. OKN36]
MTVMRWIQRQTQRLTVIAAGLLIIGIGGRFLPWLWVRPVALTLAAIVAGLPIGLRAWGALRARVISIELLVSLAAIGALIIGEVSEAAIVTFLFLFGSWLEEKTLAKTRRSIKTLTAMAPTQAWVVHEGGEPVATDVDDVEEGDVVLVKTGGQVPVDGVIMNGTGYLNEASVTGEAKLVEKTVGANVYAGTMLDNGTLTVQATRVGEETTFGKIVELVENAQDAKSPVEQFIDRFATYYTPAVLVLAVLVGVVFKDVRLAITVMVLGCPGALVIGAPCQTLRELETVLNTVCSLRVGMLWIPSAGWMLWRSIKPGR